MIVTLRSCFYTDVKSQAHILRLAKAQQQHGTAQDVQPSEALVRFAATAWVTARPSLSNGLIHRADFILPELFVEDPLVISTEVRTSF